MEMIPDTDQLSADYQAVATRNPGGAVTCAYCQCPVEYHPNTTDLVQSTRLPLRYSRKKTEDRARNYGQVFLNKGNVTPEEWIAHDKGMAGALRNYRYAEDP
jgi:hypothetical protein